MIEVDNVTMAYDRNPVVCDVTLELPDHGITALIGPNGAGKSTLLSGIGRLMELKSGSVSIDGRGLEQWQPSTLARTLAVLRQENHLSVRLTVAELVMLGRHPHTHGRVGRADEQIVADALEWVHMTDMAGRFLDELSGGQRQRAFVAMTLAQDTKYLLLDEPLSSLDMRHSRDMMRHLVNVSESKGIGVIIVIHDVNMAAAYAQRMVAMKDGRVCADGTPDEVMTREVLSSVYDIDVNVGRLGDRPVAMPVW